MMIKYDTIESMNASVESSQNIEGEKALRWILLIHQLPPKPDYLRVKVRRRLSRVGAVALKNSVYVLPNRAECVEDFHWLRRLVVDEAGEATLWFATTVEGVSDEEIELMFRDQVSSEYQELIASARTYGASVHDADVRRLERQLRHIDDRNFFGVSDAAVAASAVKTLKDTIAERMTTTPTGMAMSNADAFRGARWVTRKGVYVDRLASAWLIARFIDPAARFKFVPETGYSPDPGDIRFDMFEGEFTHEGDSCTFEVLVRRFVPGDAALEAIGEIVHDVDCKDEKFGRDEAAGVATMLRGMIASHATDLERIEAGKAIFDSLYASFRRRSA